MDFWRASFWGSSHLCWLPDSLLEAPEEAGEVQEAFGVDEGMKEKNPAAVELGRIGGLKGGPARAKKLSPRERSRIASIAANERWRRDRERFSLAEAYLRGVTMRSKCSSEE